LHKPFGKLFTLTLLSAAALMVRCGIPAAIAAVAQPEVVNEQPSEATPHIVLGCENAVYAYAQVGKTVFAGGRFDQVQSPDQSHTYNRQNFFSFDSVTGAVKPLKLSFDGLVSAIVSAPDGKSIYVGGSFKMVNGTANRGLVKFDLATQQIDTTFQPTTANGATVGDLKYAAGSLIVAGSFARQIVSLDPTTGADTGAINITVTGQNDPADSTRVRRIAVSPDSKRLVATGNFTTVNGKARSRAFELHLDVKPATLSNWHSPRFDVHCNNDRLVTLQGVDFSPDGKYFVIVSTGGAVASGFCDAAGRFETSNETATAQPTWMNDTGGDSLWSVAVTGAAVYVGGHQRWLDNAQGHDNAGPGAVSRPGIGAIDPTTGKALAWDPTKSRQHGTVELFATTCGLWVGSDGPDYFNETHAGIAFAPLPGTAADCVPKTGAK